MDGLERGSSGVESLPAEMLFGHGKMAYGETRASNAEASMSEIHYTKPAWDKRPAHTMAWIGEKENDLTSDTPPKHTPPCMPCLRPRPGRLHSAAVALIGGCVAVPAITEARRHLLDEKRAAWDHEVATQLTLLQCERQGQSGHTSSTV